MSKGMLLKIVEGHPKTALNAIRSPTNSSIYPERKVRMKKMTRKMKIYKLINAQFVYVVSFRFTSILMMLKNNRLHIAYECPKNRTGLFFKFLMQKNTYEVPI